MPLLLAAAPPEPHVVLTRRRADLRRHAGEISFPGGRQDAEDATLIDTALREAEEEIGLPREDVHVLGELPSTSTFATNYLIHPFVGQIAASRSWRPSPREVDAVLELPAASPQARARHALAHLLERLDSFIPPSRPAPPRGSPTPSKSRRSS